MSSCAGGTGGGGGTTLASIAITPASPTVYIAGTQQLTATGTYSDGTTDDISASATWSSSRTSVATVSTNGGVTGVAAGTSAISATLEGVTGTAAVTVSAAPAGKIAFVSTRDNDTNEIYVMDTDGSDQVRVTSRNGSNPKWSPDASRILFSAYDANSSLELYAVNPDGTGETTLTTPTWAADWNAQAAWSFDGTQIAFVSYRTTHTQIFTMDANGGSQTRISNGVSPAGEMTFTNPSWSPSGGTITADTHWSAPDDAGGIYAFPPNTGTQLTHSGGDYNAVWSPDGTQIAFYRTNAEANPTGNDIFVMESGGGGETELAEGINPVWSPDGSKIAFLRNLNDTGYMLFVMDADGTNEVNLMSDLDNLGVAWTPSWSPDGTMLTFGWGSNIYITNADGTGRVQITSDSMSEVGPQWSPQ